MRIWLYSLIPITIVMALITFGSTYIQHIIIMTCFYLILAVSWDILAGYTNQVSFAHCTFSLIAGYISALMSRSPDFVLEYGLGLPPPVTALIGICVGTAFGYLLGKLCLRVKGPYLSLLSIGFAIIILMIINNEEWLTRGPLGFAAPPFFGGYQNNMIYAYFSVALAIFTIFINYKIAISELGLCLRAVGDDEILASSLGIDIVNVKVKIFVISSFFASLAGIIWAHYRYVCLDLGKLETMFLVIAMVVFGGIGTLIGPIIGAIIIYPLSEYLRISYGIYHMLILSGIILIIYRILPNGIIGLIRKLIPLRL